MDSRPLARNPRKIAVVGGGVFGFAAAIELWARGNEVIVFDPGPIPHPLAESTDISKIVRLDYGDDALYSELMERALALASSDLIEPDDGVIGIGSGGAFAMAAARALVTHSTLNARGIVEQAMAIAADICVYTNTRLTIEEI